MCPPHRTLGFGQPFEAAGEEEKRQAARFRRGRVRGGGEVPAGCRATRARARPRPSAAAQRCWRRTRCYRFGSCRIRRDFDSVSTATSQSQMAVLCLEYILESTLPARGCSSVVERVLSMHEAPGSIPGTSRRRAGARRGRVPVLPLFLVLSRPAGPASHTKKPRVRPRHPGAGRRGAANAKPAGKPCRLGLRGPPGAAHSRPPPPRGAACVPRGSRPPGTPKV